MTTPEAGEGHGPCRLCDGVGKAIESCPCERCEGARRHALAEHAGLVARAKMAGRMAEALRNARRILSIHVTDDSPKEDIVDADAVDEVLAEWDSIQNPVSAERKEKK